MGRPSGGGALGRNTARRRGFRPPPEQRLNVVPVDEQAAARAYGHLLGECGVSFFGGDGSGLFPAPSAIENAVIRQYGVTFVGRTDAVRERFYAISVHRRLRHPATRAISEGARGRLFANG